MDVRIMKLHELKFSPHNARVTLKPGDNEYEDLKRSIQTFGMVDLPVWNQRTGHLVGGHQRYAVAYDLGYDEIQVVVVDLSLEQEKVLGLALNKIQGRWDEAKLAKLLDELTRVPDLDVRLTGFTLPDISELLDQQEALHEDNFDVETAVETIKQPITKLGDLLELGAHRILCGDSSDVNDVTRLMGHDTADLWATDFSYNVSYMQKNNRPSTETRPKQSRKWDQIYSDALPQKEYETWMRNVVTTITPVLKPGAAFYLFQGHRQLPPLYQLLLELDCHVSCLICWVKESAAISYGDFSFQSEHALYGWRMGAPHYWAGSPGASNVWQVKRDPTKTYLHPTQKPIELGRRAVTCSSRRGDIVLDTFLGAGGLLLACEGLGRRCFGMELDGRYVDATVRRYLNFVGQDKVSPEIRQRYAKEALHGG